METETKTKQKKEEIEEVDEAKEQLKDEIKEDLTPKKPELKIKIEGEKSVWKDIDKFVGKLKEEIPLEISKDGLNIKQADETNVAMVDMTIKKRAFDEYSVSHNAKVGINIPKMNTHLKIFDDDVTVVNQQNKLVFKGEKGKESKMGLLSVVDFDLSLPSIKYSVEMKTTAENMKKMVEVGEDFKEESLKFIIKDKKFFIVVESETDEVRFPICSVNTLKEFEGDFETLYSVEYLKAIMNFNQKDEIYIRFGHNLPVEIDFEDDKKKVKYLLAPRIESDE